MQITTPAPLGISGARTLQPETSAIVQDMAARAARGGAFIVTGCAAGADAAAVAGTLAAGGVLLMYAVGTRTGAGFPRGFVPHHLKGIETQIGVVLRWSAGGPLTLPLRARLALRSLAVVQYLKDHGGTLAAFPATPQPPRPFGSGPFPSCGSGTWSTVAAAVLKGVPVFVTSPARPSPNLPLAGWWTPTLLYNVAGWSFIPAAAPLL